VRITAFLLLLALPGFAQQQADIIPVNRGILTTADGGVVEVNDGVWFSGKEVIAMGQDHADLRKQNEHMKEHAADVPYKWLVIAGGIGLGLGLGLGFFTARAMPR